MLADPEQEFALENRDDEIRTLFEDALSSIR
jgi:hypothetical protein